MLVVVKMLFPHRWDPSIYGMPPKNGSREHGNMTRKERWLAEGFFLVWVPFRLILAYDTPINILHSKQKPLVSHLFIPYIYNWNIFLFFPPYFLYILLDTFLQFIFVRII